MRRRASRSPRVTCRPRAPRSTTAFPSRDAARSRHAASWCTREDTPQLVDELVDVLATCRGAEDVEIGPLQDDLDAGSVEPLRVDAVDVADRAIRRDRR